MTLVGFLWFLGALRERRRGVGRTRSASRSAPVGRRARAHAGRVPDRPRRAGARARVVRLGWTRLALLPLLALLVHRASRTTARTARTTCCSIWDSDTASTRDGAARHVAASPCSPASASCWSGAGAASARCSAARWRRSSGPARRSPSSACSACIPAALGADEVAEVVDTVLIVLITALPFAFLVGPAALEPLARGRRERAVRAARRR